MSRLLAISSQTPVALQVSFAEADCARACGSAAYALAYWSNDGPHIIEAAQEVSGSAARDGANVFGYFSRMFFCCQQSPASASSNGVSSQSLRARLRAVDYVFACSGNLRGTASLAAGGRPLSGASEAERAFRWLLGHLNAVSEEHFDMVLCDASAELRRLGTFELLVADGSTIWACADSQLYVLEQVPANGGCLVSPAEGNCTISLGQANGSRDQVALVATDPIDDYPGWQKLRRGELVKVRDGRVLRSQVPA